MRDKTSSVTVNAALPVPSPILVTTSRAACFLGATQALLNHWVFDPV